VNAFLTAVLEDLRAFSPDLLDPGTQRVLRLSGALRGTGTLSAELERASQLAQLVPAVLDEHERGMDLDRDSWRATPIPVRAVIAREPWAWVRAGERWLPRTWLSPEVVVRVDLRAARWIEHLLTVSARRLEVHRTRVAKHAEDARLTASETAWARVAEEELAKLLGRVDDALGALARARFLVARASGQRVNPSVSPPAPYPRTPPWLVLRELSEGILDARRALAANLSAVLAGHVDVADEPYLYQRWVGVKLLDAFSRLGWTPRGDVIGPLYLGGTIPLGCGTITAELHVEPRLTTSTAHPSGWYCTKGSEVTPDYMIIAPGAAGRDAYVLDACKSTTREVLRDKYRYLELVASVKPRRVAGVSTRLPPRRAWAAAPIDRAVCDLDRPDGACGIVPMDPVRFSPGAILDWVADIDQESRAWGSPEPAPLARVGPHAGGPR
jgi:hypothetical protein